MRRPLIYSLLLHFVVFAAAYVGLPEPDQEILSVETPVAVDIVTVAEQTNVPSVKEKPEPASKPKPASRPISKPNPKSEAKRTPPPAPPVKPEARPGEPAPDSEVAKFVPPKAKPKPAARPETVKKPAPKPSVKPVKAEPKQESKPRKRPEPEEQEESPSAFESVLKTVEQLKGQPSKTPEKPAKNQPEQAFDWQVARALSNATEPYDPGLPVTMSEIEAVRRQIERCWNLPAGAKDAENLVVSIRVEMAIDGTPRTAVVTDQGRMRSDPFYRAAAESAVRAVLNPRCHPFTLPREKYSRWKTITLVFNPKEMFGT